ncbi:AAA family ATPase [Nonomuraea fuscirosea]|uniref:AAA family ATPase n=1 Tax=Nonomuraea fuscirosea TaxID=1291556 RepID=UPI0033C22D23
MRTATGNPFPARGTMSMEEQVRDADILDAQITGPTVELPAVAGLTALVRQYLEQPSCGQVAFLHGEHGTGKTHTIRYALGGETGALRLYAKAQDGDFRALYQRLMSQVGRDRLRELSRGFQAVLAGEEAGLRRPPDPGRAELLFTELLVEPGAVLEAQADELGRVTDDGQEFQRALTSLLEPAMEEAAFAWLAGRDITPTDAARLGVSGPMTDPNQCRHGLQLLTALCARVGRPVIIVVDQCERLVLGPPSNLGVLHSLVERVPQEGGMLLLSGSGSVWAALPDDLRQRFGANHLETGVLSPGQALALLRAYLERAHVPGGGRSGGPSGRPGGPGVGPGGPEGGVGPFTEEGLRALLRLSGGNVRAFLQLAWRAFRLATAGGERGTIDRRFADRVLGTGAAMRQAADRAVEGWLLDERAGYRRGWRDGDVTADYAVLSASGPRLLVQIVDAVFTAREAADLAGLMERVRARGWPARIVLVVAGYAAPEALPLLERAAHEVVVVRGERDLHRLRGSVRPLVPDAGGVFDGLPYPGAEPFSERDAKVFFGREEAVRELAGLLSEAREPVVVTGPTGVGASSLVRAGLLPALAENGPRGTRWHGLVLVPGTAPLNELAASLSGLVDGLDTATVLAALRERPASARSIAAQAITALQNAAFPGDTLPGTALPNAGLPGNRPPGDTLPGTASPTAPLPGEGLPGDGLVLVVDGFEEVLAGAGAGDPDTAAFVAALHAVAGGPHNVLVVVVVSAPFAERCAALPELAGPAYTLGPMGRGELRRAITGPAEVAGLALEEGLVDAVLDDLRTPRGAPEPGALPLLARAMHTTWCHRDGDRLTLRGYAETGGIRRAVVDAAESAYLALDAPRQAVARTVLRRLAAISRDGRILPRRAALDGLRAEHADAAGDLDAVLRALAAARVVVVDADAVRMAHGCLAEDWPRLRDWFEEDLSGQILYDQLLDDAAAWMDSRRNPEFLYRGTRLATVLRARGRWEESGELPLDDRARLFLEAGDRARRRRRKVRGTALLALLVTVLVAGLNVASLTTAERRLRIVRDDEVSQGLAEQSALVSDPALSALLAALAWRVSPTPEARSGLLRVLGWPARRSSYRLGDPALALAFGREGDIVAAEAAKDGIRLSGVRVRRKPARIGGAGSVVAFSPDGRTLVVGGGAGVRVVDRRSLDVRDRIPTRAKPSSLSLSPDGRTLALAVAGGVQLVDLGTKEVTMRLNDNEPVLASAFSPDGRTLATGNAAGVVRLWNVRGGDQPSAALLGHVNPVTSLTFSPDGRTLATGGADATVRLWDLASNRPISVSPTGERRTVTALAFAVDARTLAGADDGGRVRLWNVEPPADLAGGACALARRDLTPVEWAKYVPAEVERRKACPAR